jgi:protein-S-isoprenylcysteine O-methyltransferase Ste14
VNDTRLSTRGIYRFSRNPIYLGVILINVASCIFFPNLFNVILAALATGIQHRIILSEEKFLEGRFGEAWRQYRKSTGRYFII